MAIKFIWKCPYCKVSSLVSYVDFSWFGEHGSSGNIYSKGNNPFNGEDYFYLRAASIICPNIKCLEVVIRSSIGGAWCQDGGYSGCSGNSYIHWSVKPSQNRPQLPDYIKKEFANYGRSYHDRGNDHCDYSSNFANFIERQEKNCLDTIGQSWFWRKGLYWGSDISRMISNQCFGFLTDLERLKSTGMITESVYESLRQEIEGKRKK